MFISLDKIKVKCNLLHNVQNTVLNVLLQSDHIVHFRSLKVCQLLTQTILSFNCIKKEKQTLIYPFLLKLGALMHIVTLEAEGK